MSALHDLIIADAPKGPGYQCRDCPVFVSAAELRDWDGNRFPDEPGRVLDAILTRRAVRTEFVTTLEQEMRNRSDGLVDVRDRDWDGDDDYYVGVDVPLTDADEDEDERTVVLGVDGEVDEALTARYHDGKAEGLRMTEEEQLRMLRDVRRAAQAPHGTEGYVPAGLASELEILDELHRRVDDLHVPPFDPGAYANSSPRPSREESRLRYQAQSDAAWGLSDLDTPITHPDVTPPQRWSRAWWCREWRFLTLRLRRWAIKRLGGDA